MWERIKAWYTAHKLPIWQGLAVVFLVFFCITACVACSSFGDVGSAQFGFSNSIVGGTE